MTNLRIPGPTPCPPEVLAAMGRQMVNHRGSEFQKTVLSVTDKLKKLFLTQNDVFLLTGSGTGGLEAAVVNSFSPGDKVLSVSIGVFGDRLANIAKTFGADVTVLKSEWGKAADTAVIKAALDNDPSIKAVMVTHNETSTGVTNDLKAISETIKPYDKLFVVDAISSIGSIALPVDEWGIDVMVTGAQKSWMVPPGIAMVALSAKAWNANAAAKTPRFYWDFARAKKTLANGGQTPWTPAVSVISALDVSLTMMIDEGLDNIIARHIKLGKMTREGIKALGLKLFADEAYASNTVTAVLGSDGLDPKTLNKIMREEYDIVLSGGQMDLDGKIFRIGHLGWVNEKDIESVLCALKSALPKAGFIGGN
ncbi:MAG: alanine--glyoxylate aminotransferase family protein [Dehalococcoidia bacterium]|nr:alanine--glyoxylate aminotransferase family protein [Dehalococcoidia bacterium]